MIYSKYCINIEDDLIFNNLNHYIALVYTQYINMD